MFLRAAQCGRRPSRRLARSVLPGLLAALFAFSGLNTDAAAQGRDVFSVSGVPVDARADNEFAAKSAGIAQAEKDALRLLMERLTLKRDHDRLPERDRPAITALIRDFSVDREKFGGGRYLASLTMRFKDDGVRKLLRGADIPFAETAGRPVLVLPVFQTAGATALWEDTNPWFAAWSRIGRRDGLQPLLLPVGDLSDVAIVSAEDAVLGDTQKLAEIAGRYGAAETMVVVASLVVDQAFGLLRVEVASTRFGGSGSDQTQFSRFEARGDASRDALLGEAAAAIAGATEDAWKQQNILDASVEQRITVRVPFDGLGQWLSIRQRLDGIAAVKELAVLQVSVDRAEVELSYLGSADQLKLAMAQSDLNLEYAADQAVWTLKTGSGR